MSLQSYAWQCKLNQFICNDCKSNTKVKNVVATQLWILLGVHSFVCKKAPVRIDSETSCPEQPGSQWFLHRPLPPFIEELTGSLSSGWALCWDARCKAGAEAEVAASKWKKQESLADAKVGAQQQCVYEGPSEEIYSNSIIGYAISYWWLIVTVTLFAYRLKYIFGVQYRAWKLPLSLTVL